jgi:hypothetical protein
VKNLWEEARQEVGKNLPAYGTKEFKEGVSKVDALAPWLREAEFKDKSGRPLSSFENMRCKANAAARILAGETVSEDTILQAVETGKRLATATNRKLSGARALGSGKSKGSLSESRNPNADLVAGIERYMRDQKSGGR